MNDWLIRPADPHRIEHLTCVLAKPRRYGLMVVYADDYPSVEADAANLFLQLVLSRNEHASLALTSNPPRSGWEGAFGDQAVAAALIDRIVHHANVLTFHGARYRLLGRWIDAYPASASAQTAQTAQSHRLRPPFTLERRK